MTSAKRTYRTLLVSGALAALAVGGTTIADGDWQAALAGLGGLPGGAFLLSLTRLLAMSERPAPVPGVSRDQHGLAVRRAGLEGPVRGGRLRRRAGLEQRVRSGPPKSGPIPVGPATGSATAR
jgi:hypothetical protein